MGKTDVRALFDYEWSIKMPWMQLEKYLLPVEGALRAIKIEKVIVTFKVNAFRTMYPSSAIVINCAGLGERQFEIKESKPLVFYENAEQYQKGDGFDYYLMAKPMNLHDIVLPLLQGQVTIDDNAYGGLVSEFSDNYEIIRWGWDGLKAIKCNVSYIPDLIYDISSQSWSLSEPITFENDTYPTMEECQAAHSIKIVGFDEAK